MKRRVLISTARSGSSWVQTYVSRYNYQHFGMYSIRDQFNGSELFNRDNKEFVLGNDRIELPTFDSKIKFLADMRSKGTEISVKIFYDQIEDNLQWFTDFYSDWEVIKLTRLDRFAHFMSYIMHTDSFLELVEKELGEGDTGFMEDFISYLNRFDRFDGYHIGFVYEDIDDAMLSPYFGVSDVPGLPDLDHFKLMLVSNKNDRDYRAECKYYDRIEQMFYTVLSDMNDSKRPDPKHDPA